MLTKSAVPTLRLRDLAVAATLMLAAPLAAAEPVVAPSPQIHDGASEPGKAWDKAMEAGDLAALARMHDAATTSYPPDKMQVKGATAIMKDYADLFAEYTVKVTSEDMHWIEQPPFVVSWGLTTMTLHPKAGGADIVSKTRFTDAAIRTKDGWRYVIDHASVPTGK